MDLVDWSGQEKWIVLISGGKKLAKLEKQYLYASAYPIGESNKVSPTYSRASSIALLAERVDVDVTYCTLPGNLLTLHCPSYCNLWHSHKNIWAFSILKTPQQLHHNNSTTTPLPPSPSPTQRQNGITPAQQYDGRPGHSYRGWTLPSSARWQPHHKIFRNLKATACLTSYCQAPGLPGPLPWQAGE